MGVLLENKKARFDYEILETIEAGLELRGWEVKAFKSKKGSLLGSRVIIRGGEAFIVGLTVQPYQPGNIPAEFDEQRTIRVLLKKKEIAYLEEKLKQRGLTIVPIKLYTKAKKIKVELGLVKGKKKFDKREVIKKREAERSMGRKFKNSF